MIGYSLDAEAFYNMGVEGLRAELGKLAHYVEELEEEKEALQDELEDAREEIRSLEKDIEEKETEELDAGENVAEALETFTKYQGEAGGFWYRRDLAELFENIADGLDGIAGGEAIRKAAPIF